MTWLDRRHNNAWVWCIWTSILLSGAPCARSRLDGITTPADAFLYELEISSDWYDSQFVGHPNTTSLGDETFFIESLVKICTVRRRCRS